VVGPLWSTVLPIRPVRQHCQDLLTSPLYEMRTRDQFIIPAQAQDFYQLLALILVWCLALPTPFPAGLGGGYITNPARQATACGTRSAHKPQPCFKLNNINS